MKLKIAKGVASVWRDRRGAIAVQAALMMVTLVGFAAMGLEITSLLLQQRKMQAAADAAAMAAGTTGRTTTQALSEAVATVGSYGFVNGSNGVTVSFNKPPLTGTFASGASEVLIARTRKPGLLGLFLTGNLTIRVRAVTAPGRRSYGCLLAKDATDSGAVTIRNNSSITNTNCELVSNSTNATALILENSAHILGPVYLLGGYQLGQNSTITGTPLVTNGPTVVDDPYAAVTLPTAPACTAQSASVSGTKTLNAGHFCSGLTLANNAKLTLNAGVYFIDGAFSMGNNASITGTAGVTLLFNSAPSIALSPGVTLTLTAPLTGTTAGMALASQRTITGTFAINNGATLKVEGAIYLPGMTASISGNARTTGAACTQLIANRLDLASNIQLQADCTGTAVKPIGRTQSVLVD